MRRSNNHPVLTDAVARFQAEVSRLAFDAVREIVRRELERRPAAPARPPRVARRRAAPVPRVEAPAPAPAPVTAAPPPPPPSPAADGASASGRKRVPWTRESVVDELTKWMLSGTSIDATFVKRHGPPGLVAATRRIFGRFEAALNVAGLNISKLYPEGPPNRRPS